MEASQCDAGTVFQAVSSSTTAATGGGFACRARRRKKHGRSFHPAAALPRPTPAWPRMWLATCTRGRSSSTGRPTSGGSPGARTALRFALWLPLRDLRGSGGRRLASPTTASGRWTCTFRRYPHAVHLVLRWCLRRRPCLPGDHRPRRVMDRGPALISHDFGLYLEGRGLGHILASPHELPVGNAWYNTERYHEGLPRGAWQRHAGRCILRPTGKHLEPSAETQSKDAGASPASKPGNGQAERNRPHRETLTCAKGITVSLVMGQLQAPLRRRRRT